MIETKHSTSINAAIEGVWDYVQDIRQWATLFPGCRECEVIDADNSRWVIKVGAGGLVKTVKVLVHIDQWDGPERVNFSFKLENEPVIGSGSYIASPKSAHETEIILKVCVEGSGSMAPMWEAMSRPLLPQLAKTFSEKLKSEIETALGSSTSAVVEKYTAVTRLFKWLRKLWRAIIGAKPAADSN
jgi:carbon monoxide dehydrogenase subunit G